MIEPGQVYQAPDGTLREVMGWDDEGRVIVRTVKAISPTTMRTWQERSQASLVEPDAAPHLSIRVARILKLLRANRDRTFQAAEVGLAIGLAPGDARVYLWRLAQAGLLRHVARGQYQAP